MESYGDGMRPAERPRFTKAAGVSLQGRDILLIEDIIDTGHTIGHLRSLLQAQAPRSVALCALLDKVDRREVPVTIEYRGFVIPDAFVVGYGLDHAQQYRHLPYVAILEPVEGAGGEPA